MSQDSEVAQLYSARINLWVEDAVTKAYLQIAWNNDPAIRILIGGRRDGVRAAADHAKQGGINNVFGFIDRDFWTTNFNHWGDLAKTFSVFVSPMHEFENYLLDANALASCDVSNRGRTEQQIRERMRYRAAELVPWMACKNVIAEIRELLIGDFLPHPKCPEVLTIEDAESYVTCSDWYTRLAAAAEHVCNADEIKTKILASQEKYANHIAEDSWQTEFSGKELFRHVRGWLYAAPDKKASPLIQDSDLAKSVAQWHVDNQRVPTELIELRNALRRRVGL